MVRKRVQFNNDTWEAIEAVMHDIGKTFQPWRPNLLPRNWQRRHIGGQQ